MERLDAGGRAPEHHERPVLVSQVESEFTGMVARGGVLLLERGIVLFVQNHDIEIERRKYRAAGPKNHTRAPLQYRHEGFTPFGGRERRVQHLHRNMQEFLKTARRLRGEPDFGNQDKHAHVPQPGPRIPVREDGEKAHDNDGCVFCGISEQAPPQIRGSAL